MAKVKTPRVVFHRLVARAAPGKEKVTAVRHLVAPVTAATEKVRDTVVHHLGALAGVAMEKVNPVKEVHTAA